MRAAAVAPLLLLLLSWQPLLAAPATPVQQLSLGWSGVVRQTRHNTCGPALLASLLVGAGRAGSELTVAELAQLEAFLRTLTGPLSAPAPFLAPPR